MKKQTKILNWYWTWAESPISPIVHWAFFVSVALVITVHLVSAITVSATENDGFGINPDITEMMNQN